MRKLATIASQFLLIFSVQAQLYVPAGTELSVSNGATLTSGANLENDGTIEVGPQGELLSLNNLSNRGELLIQSQGKLNVSKGLTNPGTVDLADQAQATVSGNLNNSGSFQIGSGNQQTEAMFFGLGNVTNTGLINNVGTVTLFSNWTNEGVYNSNLGKMSFQGGANQTIFNSYLRIENLEVNKAGRVTLTGDSVKITNRLGFLDGVLSAGENTRFIVDTDAEIDYLTGFYNSYFEGTLIARGLRNRVFPVGDGDFYGSIGLIDMMGINPEVAVSMTHQPVVAPIPGGDLVGVSGQNKWQVELRKGSIDSVQIQIDFIAEDLENFDIENDVRRFFDSPVVAESSEGIEGPYLSLGIESLSNSDSLTTGLILSKEYAKYDQPGSRYYAIALEPQLDAEGQIYFPNVFAPEASDPDNQVFKVFGHGIANQPFKLEIYNRWSVLVYETDTFEEANTLGWDGQNRTGREEQSGIYYVYVKYAYSNNPEAIRDYNGPVLLKR